MSSKSVLLGMGWFALVLMGALVVAARLSGVEASVASQVRFLSVGVAIMAILSSVHPLTNWFERVRLRRRLARDGGTVEDLLTFVDRATRPNKWWVGALEPADAERVLPVVVRWADGQWNPNSVRFWRWRGPYREASGVDVGAVYRWLTARRPHGAEEAALTLLVDCLDARLSGVDMDAHRTGRRFLDEAAVAVVASLRRPLPC